MRENISAQPTLDNKPRPAEIVREGDAWFLTMGNSHRIPVPATLGLNMQRAMRVQKMVDDTLVAGVDQEFLKYMRMLNCRKGALMLTGDIPIREAVSFDHPKLSTIKKSPRTALDEDIRDRDGILDLMRDVERLLELGVAPTFGRGHSEHITSGLDKIHPFPCIVHLFGISAENVAKIQQKSHSEDLKIEEFFRSKLGLYHTFLVLGKDNDGKYICFHKQGPDIRSGFEIESLESVLTFYLPLEESQHHMAMIGPINETPES